jgi:2-amino-4-hydroxy-6-hydroxymethyldihydropteridine diphosphokinase
VKIFLGIGSNLGDRLQNLNDCMDEFSIIQKSSIYETEPVGFLDQPWFLNAVIQIDSILRPRELLEQCQSVETRLKRKREIPKGPRSIDIDILFYGEQILQEQDLIIPHPEIQNRGFVLVPLNEIASDFVHPVFKKTISELLEICPDTSIVNCRLKAGAP